MNQIEERKATYVRFPYGRIVATRRILEELSGLTISRLLTRHLHCDWGDICDKDWKLNDHAVKNGERLLSAYLVAGERCLSSPNGIALLLRFCLQTNIDAKGHEKC